MSLALKTLCFGSRVCGVGNPAYFQKRLQQTRVLKLLYVAYVCSPALSRAGEYDTATCNHQVVTVRMALDGYYAKITMLLLLLIRLVEQVLLPQ